MSDEVYPVDSPEAAESVPRVTWPSLAAEKVSETA